MSFPRIIGLLAVLALGAGAQAADVVLFEDGRQMVVQSTRVESGMTLLALDGGGEIAVPSERIRRVRPLVVKPRPKPKPPVPSPAGRPGLRGRSDVWRGAAGPYAEIIAGAALRHDLDPALLAAVAMVESAFNAAAVSPKGAQGLLQLMPATADRFGVSDAFDAAQNVDGGAAYLKWLLERFEGDTELALAGYNAGEGAVDRHRGIPPYRETRNYVAKVLAGLDRFQGALR